MNDQIGSRIQLQVSAKPTATSLDIEYRVSNGSDEPIYLLDRQSQTEKGGLTIVNENFANVMLDGSAVRVVRGVMPLPMSFNINARPPTFITEVAPRQTVAKTLSLPLPLAERRLFFAPAPSDKRQAVSRIDFELGFTEPRPGMSLETRQTTTGPERMLKGLWPAPYQRVLRASVNVPPLDVVVHAEPFERAKLVQ